MALRVVAHPIVLSVPAPGLVALCSNGKIVYVSLETGQPVQSETETSEVACPYAGLTALNTGAATDLRSHLIHASPVDPFTANHQIRAERRALAHAPRAPPVLI